MPNGEHDYSEFKDDAPGDNLLAQISVTALEQQQAEAEVARLEDKLKTAKELADLLEDLSPEEREILKKSLDDIISDTPQTAVAANKIKILVAKVGKIAAEQLRELVVDIASETAKKLIWH